MTALFVGGDRLQKFENYLKSYGFNKFKHVSGRKKRDGRVGIKTNPDLCILFVNFVSHNLAESVRRECKNKGITLICSERKWCHLQPKLANKSFKKCEGCTLN